MEEFDKEVELALYFGQDPQEHIAGLTRITTVRDRSTDLLQLALESHYRQTQEIAYAAAYARERRAYLLMKQAEAHLQACVDHWSKCDAERQAAKPEEN